MIRPGIRLSVILSGAKDLRDPSPSRAQGQDDKETHLQANVRVLAVDERVVILPLSCSSLILSPTLTKVPPSRVPCFDQCDLLLPQPAFDHLLPVYGIMNIIEVFKIYQSSYVIPCSEARKFLVGVLPKALLQIVGNTGIEHRAYFVCKNVDVVVVFTSHYQSP